MEPLVSDVTSQNSHNPEHHPAGKREIVGVTIIAVVAVVTFLFIYPPSGLAIQNAVSASMLPKELKTARFSPASFASAPAATYVPDGLTYKKTYYDGRIISVAQGLPEVVVAEGTDGFFRVFVSSVSVYASQTPILGAAISPRGQSVAITRQATTSPESRSARDYDVVLIVPATGREFTIGSGFAPTFIDDTTLLWISPAGVHSRNIATGETKLLVKHTFTNVVSSATYSPDKTLVAWSDLAGTSTDVYSIKTGMKVASFADVLPLITLTNTGLLSLTPQEWRTTVTYYSFDGSASRMIHWLPGSYQIRKIAL